MSPDVSDPSDRHALFELLPGLASRLPRVSLGAWPSPVEPLDGLADTFVKREDISASGYGGNKIRPLEVMFALAQRAGARRIWSTGAMGSNHALAAAIHAPRAGLEAGALLFPQPPSPTARANLRALYTTGCALRLERSVVQFPFGALRLSRSKDYVMAPGAAVPMGAIGHLSAGLELALQIEAGAAPPLRHIVLAVGSTCTTAGLLVAFALAARLGVGWRDETATPHIHAVRVTPWPITAPWRIARLAAQTAALLVSLGGPDLGMRPRDFGRRLSVHGRFIGRGYGHPTRSGREAIAKFDARGGPPLDTTYSAKAGAFLLERRDALSGPALFWATKSSLPLPEPEEPLDAPRFVRRWLAKGDADQPRT